MSEPISFTSYDRIKEGKAEDFRAYYRSSIRPTLEAKPGTLVQPGYENEETAEFKVIRLFPDADALDLQMQGADERLTKTDEFIEPTGIEISGMPNPVTLEKMRRIAGSGVIVSIHPDYIGGFIR